MRRWLVGSDDCRGGWFVGQVLASSLQATLLEPAKEEESDSDEDQDSGCRWVSEGSIMSTQEGWAAYLSLQ